MFRKRRTVGSGVSKSNDGSGGCEYIDSPLWGQSSDGLFPPATKQRVVDCTKVLLDVAKESADWFPPLKAALGGVSALINHYEVSIHRVEGHLIQLIRSQQFNDVKEKIGDLVPQLERFKQIITTATVDGDPEETGRRTVLTGCVSRLTTVTTALNGRRSTFKQIEESSQKLLAKKSFARFADKDKDSKLVVGLIERLREAMVCYQVSDCCPPESGAVYRRSRYHNSRQSTIESLISL